MGDKQITENAFEALVRNAMEQDEKKRKKIFLEIGTGQVPVALLPNGRKFDPKTEEYIGIDSELQNVESNRDALTILDDTRGNIFFETWKGQEIDLPDKTVDEVFMGNVVGE